MHLFWVWIYRLSRQLILSCSFSFFFIKIWFNFIRCSIPYQKIVSIKDHIIFLHAPYLILYTYSRLKVLSNVVYLNQKFIFWLHHLSCFSTLHIMLLWNIILYSSIVRKQSWLHLPNTSIVCNRIIVNSRINHILYFTTGSKTFVNWKWLMMKMFECSWENISWGHWTASMVCTF